MKASRNKLAGDGHERTCPPPHPPLHHHPYRITRRPSYSIHYQYFGYPRRLATSPTNPLRLNSSSHCFQDCAWVFFPSSFIREGQVATIADTDPQLTPATSRPRPPPLSSCTWSFANTRLYHIHVQNRLLCVSLGFCTNMIAYIA